MAIRLGKWDFNKEMVSMAAAFLVWVVYQTYSISEWKTKTDDLLIQLKAQTESMADTQARQIPDHEHRITIIEAQLPAIKSGVEGIDRKVDGVDRKIDALLEKLTKVPPP